MITPHLNKAKPTEGLQPRAHWAPDTPARRFFFLLRQVGDLQTRTIYRDLRHMLRGFSGRLLDVGCGNSPFRHLLDSKNAKYEGVDVNEAASFGYHNPDVTYYDGTTIPHADDSFDAVLCTEVLEHVPDAPPFIAELHRVAKPNALVLITIPWSARFHYQPHDYHRYTPTQLAALFATFSSCEITPRGTDLTTIASKVIVAYARNLTRIRPKRATDWLWIPVRLLVALFGLPLLALALLLGHAGILFGLGSHDDPLGYTIVLKK